jgi:hypothetical protein
MMNGEHNNAAKIWVGVAIGTAVGLGYALSRRRHSRWDTARQIPKRVAARSDDLTDVGRDMIERMRNIYNESRKVMEEATELWTSGRRIVGY